MSYSRWSKSRFYTYWSIRDDRSQKRDDQLFCVDCDHYFTYKQLKEDMEKCLDEANTPTDNLLNPGFEKPIEELGKELKGYMEDFIKDIESENFNIEP